MEKNKYIQLYSFSDNVEYAVLLINGNVYLYPSEKDKYVINGKNIIIGSTELILNKLLGIETVRIETAITTQNSKFKKIPSEKFITSLNSFSFILNVSMVIAKQVLLSNQIITNNLRTLSNAELKNRELTVEYFNIITELISEFKQRKHPWLKNLISKHEINLSYKQGQAFAKANEPTKITTPIHLDNNIIEYPSGSTICEEGTIGDEMYILQSGMIDVIIGKNKIITINEKGTIFGEMALLLNEKRTATLRSKNSVIAIRIKKNELKEVFSTQQEIITSLATSLAQKHYYNILKIDSINEIQSEKNIHKSDSEKKKEKLQSHRSYINLQDLKKEITEIYENKEAEFLKKILEKF